MKLKSLTARNFTGCNFDIVFGDVTIITGDNFAGKTSIPNAIRLLLTGSLPPPIGIKEIYSLAGDSEAAGQMSLAAEMDNGRKVSLTWNRDAKGKIACTGGIPSDLVMPPMLANPNSFWAKTSAERIQIVADACPNAGADLAKTITGRLSEVQIVPFKLAEPVLTEVRNWIKSSFSNESPPTAIANLVDHIKVEAKIASDDLKFTSGTLAGFKMKVKPASVDAELESMRQELAKLQLGEEGNRSIHERGLSEINAKLEAYSRKYKGTPVEHLAEFINAQNHTVAKDLRILPPPLPMDEAEEDLKEAQEDFRQAVAAEQSHAQTCNDLQKLLGDIQISETCPFCRNAAAGWKELAANAVRSDLERTNKALAKATAAKVTAEATVYRLGLTIESIKKSSATYAERKQELMQEAQQFECDFNNVQDLIQSKKESERFLQQCAESVAQEKAKALQTRIAELQEIQNACSAYESSIEERAAAEEKLVLAQVRADALKQSLKIIIEEQQKSSETAFSAVIKTARAFTDGILNSHLEFIDGDLGRRVSDLDLQRFGFVAKVGSWISHKTFSDSEKRIAYIGFSVALAMDAPMKLVIVDEMATIAKSRKIQFVDRLIQLTRKGVIDQAICLEPAAEDYAGFEPEKGVRLIRL